MSCFKGLYLQQCFFLFLHCFFEASQFCTETAKKKFQKNEYLLLYLIRQNFQGNHYKSGIAIFAITHTVPLSIAFKFLLK